MTVNQWLGVVVLLMSVVPRYAGGETAGDDLRCVVDSSWPQKPESFTWGAMSGIAVDARDQVYLFNRSAPAGALIGAQPKAKIDELLGSVR